MEQVKKNTPHERLLRKKRQVRIAVFVIVDIILLLCFGGVFYHKRQLPITQVTEISLSSSDIRYSVREGTYRAQVFEVNDERYIISARFKNCFYDAMDKEQEFTLIVTASSRAFTFGKQEIVGIRGEHTTYFALSDYNAANAWVPYVYLSFFLVVEFSYIFFAVIYMFAYRR